MKVELDPHVVVVSQNVSQRDRPIFRNEIEAGPRNSALLDRALRITPATNQRNYRGPDILGRTRIRNARREFLAVEGPKWSGDG